MELGGRVGPGEDPEQGPVQDGHDQPDQQQGERHMGGLGHNQRRHPGPGRRDPDDDPGDNQGVNQPTGPPAAGKTPRPPLP